MGDHNGPQILQIDKFISWIEELMAFSFIIYSYDKKHAQIIYKFQLRLSSSEDEEHFLAISKIN